ncbi:toxin co-regulated pilus biosynthesis Q family protein [Pseudomonas guariconensis]|uniref:toxin co-regulated pilus biosynthesis Q family protein n=1 Tax=Pseudomonas guariconensis TaxID=1288410 RepID=UPI003EDF5B17
MRTPTLLSLATTLALSGCVTPPQHNPESSDSWVDNQIAQSATSISLAQQRLHTTSAARQATNLTGVTTSAPLPQTSPLRSLPATGPGLVSSVSVPAKSFPVTPAPPPTIINVIAAPAVAPAKPVVKAAAVAAPSSKSTSGPSKPLVASTPAAPIVAPAKPEEVWTLAPTDVTLRRVLAKWADRAGWQLVWDAPVDVPLAVNATLKGDFRTVVKKLFLSLSAADVNLTGYLYAGNRVLRVAESGRRAE